MRLLTLPSRLTCVAPPTQLVDQAGKYDGPMTIMTKEDRRRIEARRKRIRIRRAKGAFIGTVAIVMPLLFFLAVQR
ncbi:MAG: hypothetical protein K2Y17_07185 [Qipengyuania sp.]|nr:hypothetical protein [Qipengyuania sp.]